MKLPVEFHDTRYDTMYTITYPSEIFTYCELIMDDFRTEKYNRIDTLLDLYNNWDAALKAWMETPDE